MKMAILLGLMLLVLGCTASGDSMDKSGDNLNDTMEETGDTMNETMEETGDSMEEPGDSMEETGDQMNETMEETGDSMEETVEEPGDTMEETGDSMEEPGDTMEGPVNDSFQQDPLIPAIPAVEVSMHNEKFNCWIVFEGKVYDVTGWIPRHPGGEEAIIQFCGMTDSSFEEAFGSQHGESKVEVLEREGVLLGSLE